MGPPRGAELTRQDGHPVSQGDIGKLARVASRHADPQARSSVRSPHFEVWQELSQEIHGLSAAGGKLAVTMPPQLWEPTHQTRRNKLGKLRRAQIGDRLGLPQTRNQMFRSPDPPDP